METILKALRQQLKENDQLNSVEEIAGPTPDITFEYDQILQGEGFWDDVNGGYLPEDLVLAARREEIDWVDSEGIYEIVPIQDCRDAGKKLLELIWVDTDKSVGPAHNKIRSRLCARESKTKKQGNIQRAVPHDVSWLVERRTTIEFETLYQLLNCSLQCNLSKL